MENSKSQHSKVYDLEERTLAFARNCRRFIKNIPNSIEKNEDAKQLIRSSGSVGANYIEANEAISKKDCIHRVRISRKEAKESYYWLNLLECPDSEKIFQKTLKQEALELTKILASIITKLSH